MKLKKVLIFALSLFLVASTSITASAETQPTGGSTWKVMVLVLPDVSVSQFGQPNKVTNMNYDEIEKVTQLANELKGWSNGHLKLDVDVKVDYEDITSLSFGIGTGISLTPQDIKSQIDRNSSVGEYDTILAVYRSVDQYGNVDLGTSMQPFDRTEAANGATFASLRLDDSNHKLEQFDGFKAEQKLVVPALQSVYAELKPSHPELQEPLFMAPDQQFNYGLIKTYMCIESEGSIAAYWNEFTAK